MKKKISSLLTIVFVLFAGLFATACGNKYKNFEFKVYYAFSADSTEWFDGTDGISLNYDKRETLEEGETPSSLIFTNDVSVLYIKVEVDGVKAKHVDTISISATSLGGLNFAGATVREGEVVGITITDTVNTTIKIYENNSGRRCETQLVVMKQLAKLELEASDETPAMLIGQNSTLNLPALNNIKYFSLDYVDEQGEEHFKEGETNQTGVTYTIEGIGKYTNGSFAPGLKNIDGVFEIDGGFLKYLVKDEENVNGEKFEIDPNNHALKIKATSIFHPGTEEEGFTDAISCEFYVCLASTMPQPVVLFRDGKNADGTNIKVETVHLYQNGIKDDQKNYSASYINIGPKYDPVYTVNISLYVNVADKGQPENFIKYDFNSGNNEIVSKAGLTITEEGATEGGDYVKYKIAIANVELLRENKAKVVYEIDGLDFSCGSKQPGETLFDIRKHVVPKEILINNNVVKDDTVIDVYYTTAKYDGIRLDIVATPNEDAARELTLEYNKNISIRDAYKNIIPTTVNGNIATSKIKSGSTIYVKFTADHNNSGTDSNTVTISTSTQGEYDGGRGMVGSVSAVCKLNKIVTANSLAFITEKGEDVTQSSEFLVDAAKDGIVYLKVNYSNGALEKKSIKVTSANPSVKFGNGLNEILLSDTKIEGGAPISNGNGLFYSIFKIPVQACNSAQASAITAAAGGVTGGIVSSEMRLKSVVVAGDDWSKVAIKPVNAEDVLTFNNGFAIRKGESATFEFVNADWIFDLDPASSNKNDIPNDVFDYGAVTITKAANSKFIVKGNIENKTAIIKVTPVYYNGELIIPEERESFEIQVAVYDPIVKVDYVFEGDNTISYVNAFDRDIRSTTFTMTGKTSSNGTPTTQLVFKGESENEVIDNFSQVQVDLEKTENVKVYFNGTELTGKTLVSTNGVIKVELIAEENSARNVSVILTPYVYDGVYQQGDPTSVGINIKDAIKSRKLSLSGGGLDDEHDTINMSFMDITEGGYDQKILYARLEMEDGTISTSVDKDVAYLVYKYVQNSDGSFEEDAAGNRVVERMHTNAVTVEFVGNKIVIKAFKEFGGGRYMLVLVPKDAYKGTDTENITKDDFDASKMVVLDLNVRDGSAIAPYQVADYNDLLSINNNIGQVNVHYELTNNLDLRKYDLTPIGLIGDTVNAFQGIFNGAAGTNNQSDSGTIHTIYLNIDKAVTSSNYGNLAGLFALLGESAIIKNLNLVVDFTLSKSYGYIGALAGVNKGQINNVKVTINNTNNINLGVAEKSSFGGLVGLNENKISASRVEVAKATKINVMSNANIGAIAGVNQGEITGEYCGVESLDNFTFDVLSNLEVVNSTSNKVLYVGGVAGVNNGTIHNMLVGGKLAVGHIDDVTNPKDSFLGGIVGINEPQEDDDSALIDTVAALALDIESTAKGVDVAGIAGFAKGSINYAKYITAQVVFGFGQTNGQIKGLANVAGLVAKAEEVVITYSSVESFVLTQINQEKESEKSNYPTLINNAAADTDFVTAGLVASGTAEISNSFVKGNIIGNNIYLLSNNTISDCYFIGFADETKINANGKLATYYILYDFVTNEVLNNSSYSEQSGANWGNEADINKVGGVDYSYIIKDSAPLMILAPQSISASLNQEYKVKPGSIYVSEFDITLYENKIEETILVNYFNNAGNEGNTHNIVHTEDQKGLVTITKIPANAQTGLRYEIVGDGYRFAYINSNNQIVFTGASGKVPVLVRIYSIFNPDVESYVVFYSHILASKISIGSEEISLYTGMGGKVLSMQAENIYKGQENLTLFNASDLEQYLYVEATIKGAGDAEISAADSKLIVSPSSYNNIFIIIKDDVTLADTQFEDVYLTLRLSKDYFETATVTNDIVLATVKVKVNLYNVASGVNITGNKEEMPTNGDLSFKAYLNTDYYNTTSTEKVFTSNYLNANANDVEIVDKNKAFIVRDKDEDCDAIKVKFVVTNGEEEAARLLKQAGKEHFIDLFDITFIRSLRVVEGVTVGYIYDIQAELKDQFEYRYITSNIEFEIIVSAESNDSATDSMVVTLKPTMATTLSFKTYAVQKLQMETDYTSLVTSENEEVLIIEPGKLGNIFLINIQPAYAFIDMATITSSELYVPSLGRNVRMMFTQLVYRDGSNGSTGSWTTTLGTNVQDGNTLELQRISKVNKNGISIYDGRICLYVQVEGFSGLAGNLTATISVTSKSGDDEQTLVRNKMLTTTYLPGVNVLYDSNKLIENNRYYIQEGTSNNLVDIKIQGYQFNADPIVTFSWVSFENGEYKDIAIDGKLVGDYVTWYFVNDKDSAKYSSIDDSYTIGIKMAVSKDMPSAFAIEVNQSLVGKDGAITTAKKRVIFNPVDYFLNSLYVSNVNMEINQSDNLNLVFNTDNNTFNPVADMIELFKSAYGDSFVQELKKAFTFFKDGNTLSFADNNEQFVVDYDEDRKTLSIHGLKTFSAVVNFAVNYYYKEVTVEVDGNVKGTGIYQIKFGTENNPSVKTTTFNMDITPVNTEVEILVREASDIFANGQWKLQEGANYVLLNDITLENITPITTAIKSFDGNNRIITIKSFLVNDSLSDYGLFANIEQGTTLRNIMVDYSKFDTLALNNNTTNEVVFGGLVANNNGGIIYNCDVINNSVNNVEISIIVSDTTDVVFGGLVGKNTGVITNSRVGRNSYTRVEQDRVPTDVDLGGLTFEIFNQIIDDNTNNKFNILAGGFVGENRGTITTSYVSKTNLINHSNANTANGTNQTAGFVARNSGDIQYSYVRANEDTITYSNPYATGYSVSNKGNGIVAGFVFENRGTISNAYANTELRTDSAYIAGFVYTNSGAIHESYAACTMNAGSVDNNAEQPFVGLSEKNELQSFGKLENTYYLIRSANDVPIQQGDKDIAYGLDYTNIQNSEYLVGFAFVLTNTKQEREQGIWSYYSIDGKQRALPELINADNIAHSYRYLKDMGDGTEVLTNVVEFKQGKSTNPYTISNAEEFNKVFKSTGNEFVGSVRFINNIDFTGLSVQTRTNFVLGKSGELTSVDGNGLSIKNIYLEADETTLDRIGLFAGIENAYIKNLNLNFIDSQAGDQFSTTTAVYSGGLAGKINDSVILNITLDGKNTTLTGYNFVGGLAGLVAGDSLIYGVTTNISVRATATGDGLYYRSADFAALNISAGTSLSYEDYLKTLSYAGGVAGVIDINSRANTKFNVQYIDVFGSQMASKQNQGATDANILAEYAGGVAGYAGRTTDAYRLRYYTGENERIVGDTAVGGIYGVLFGDMTACQVTADIDTQFEYDTLVGDYVTALHNNEENAELNKEEVGNLNLLQSNKYAGGLVGVAAGASLKATYAKVGISSGSTIGGLIGCSVSSIVNYSYAIPYVDVDNIPTKTIDDENIKIYIGGLMGEAHSITSKKETVGAYINYLKRYNGSHQGTDVQFTYSTLIVDNKEYEGDITMDYVVAEFLKDGKETMLQSNASAKLVYVFAGTVDYGDAEILPDGTIEVTNSPVQNQTSADSGSKNESSIMELHKLFPDNDEDVEQQVAFQDVFSAWSVIKYWSLKKERYFPLLMNDIVDNLIEIKNENDINKIINNPDADFIIVDDITISVQQSNWVINPTFTGTITGARKSDNRRPVITVKGLEAQTEEETMGFFRETRNAKITNIEIIWGGGLKNQKGGFNTNGKNITMVSGLVCKDDNTLISNVMVSGSIYETSGSADDNAGYVLSTSEPITGFAGIVGSGGRTNVMGCVFAGKVQATFNTASTAVHVGAIAGSVQTNDLDSDINFEDAQNAIITNTQVGVAQEQANEEDGGRRYPKTEFTLTFNQGSEAIYIGGIAAKANHVGLSNNIVGGAAYESEDYQNILFNLSFTKTSGHVYFGGLAGYAERGLISACKAVTKTCVTGDIETVGAESGNNVNFGGLLGRYSQNNYDPGISDSSTRFNLTAANDNASLHALADNTNVRLTSGVAELYDYTTLNRCLFTGEINTEGVEGQTPAIKNLYAGSVAAYNGTTSIVQINEVNTNTVNIVGTPSTEQLYAGGIIGWASAISVKDCANWDRIIPITSADAGAVYVGGAIGKIGTTESKATVKVENAYSAVSIITDSIGPKSISIMNLGAFLGGMDEEEGSVKDITLKNVFYSTDLALTPEENEIDGKVIGTNYEAATLLRNPNWHAEFIALNKDVWKNANSSIPYLTKLEDMMKEYQILTKPYATYEFRKGSVFNPIVIKNSGSITRDVNSYNYYLLSTTEDDNKIKLTDIDNLHGIIIGEDKGVTISQNLVGNVNRHSAISNVHVALENHKAFFSNAVVAQENNGVIFNCSVQGTGITATALSGVIAGRNSGMISHSYSGVELIDAASTSGICANNEMGRLLSNYFTGYINSTSGYGITQYTGSQAAKSYMYNNYMGGVVNTTGRYSKVANISEMQPLAGANNYVDTFSDIQYAQVGKATAQDDKTPLKAVPTSELMKEGLLNGKWYYAAAEEADVVTLNTNATTFGYNYNYPVYNFNKQEYGVEAEGRQPLDTKHLLYTGNGLFEEDTDIELTSESSYEARYNDLVKNNRVNYYNAFKIPHLGVLSSVLSIVENTPIEDETQTLSDSEGTIAATKNFVFIYDIDGSYNDGNEEKYVEWKYEEHSINGFKLTTFSGVAISHKYYGNNENDTKEAEPVTIKNISHHGLFNEVGKAYLGNIILGSFKDLVNSGALAVKTTDPSNTEIGAVITLEAQINTSLKEIVVNNITFEDGSIISGKDESNNAFGTLFGTVYEKLLVKNYKTGSSNSTVLVGLDAKSNANAGLIAGVCKDGIIMLDKDTDSTFYANIVGGKYAGGIVGNLAGGHIIGEGNTINIYDNTAFNESLGVMQTPQFIGGVAGLSTKAVNSDGLSYIHNINVNLIGQGTDIIINTNAFGGVIGEVQSGTVAIGSADMDSELQVLSEINYTSGGVYITAGDKGAGVADKTITFKSDGEGNYYGLTVGLINGGKVDVVNFDIGNKTAGGTTSKEKWIIEIVKENDEITTQAEGFTRTIDDNSNEYGTAIFVGAMKNNQASDADSGLKFNGQEYDFDIKLKSESVPNIGGVIGFYEDGELDINISFAEEVFIKVEGSTNIGGLIGYATEKIKFAEGAGLGLFASEKEFAKISVLPGKNVGGLIGKWTLTDVYNAGFINPNSIAMDYLELEDENYTTSIQNGEHVENVGGVVGYLSTTGEISGLANKGNIEYGNIIEEDYIGDMNTKARDDIGEIEGRFTFLLGVNVGGVVGTINGGTISNLTNAGNIAGYQNVGGLVGTLTKGEKDTILTNCGIDIGENDYITYDGSQFVINKETVGDSSNEPGESDSEEIDEEGASPIESASNGNVTGVLNVGGVVGFANDGTTISKTATIANVKGNANVGGLVGETYGATLSSNIVGKTTFNSTSPEVAPTAEDTKTSIKGIYYSQYGIVEDKINLISSYIPTSVGGLAGKATNGTYEYNFENDILIESAEEGGTNLLVQAAAGQEKVRNAAISVDKNNMVDIWDEDCFANYYSIKEKIEDFDKISSGYGGIFGSSKNTTLDSGALINIKLDAMLGVNVGTYYGAYLSTNSNVGTLTIYGNVSIAGAYNIGGIIGYIDISKGLGSIDGISDQNLKVDGNSVVEVQNSNLIGINVGGLIGKTYSNDISGLSLTNSKITIYTENNYNVGGVIGCAEVTGSATISELKFKGSVQGDDKNNFGGLIGFLKVGKGGGRETISVTGVHDNAFTINTIENVNYADGQSSFSASEDRADLTLFAEAFYINKDTFNISPTSNVEIYGPGANNPTDSTSKGWAKEYTGFKVLQRCIPKDVKEGGTQGWDSISVVYDAGNIKRVGTVGNLKLEEGVAPENKVYSDDYICFTIYEQQDGIPVLYSRIGIASPVYSEESTESIYADIRTEKGNGWAAAFGSLLGSGISDKKEEYIIANHRDQNLALKALHYFNWRTEYHTLDNEKTNFQGAVEGSTLYIKELAYYVPEYPNGSVAYNGQHNGLWFKFDVVYENSSSNGLPGKDIDLSKADGVWSNTFNAVDHVSYRGNDANLPSSGSIFDACGIYTSEGDIVRRNVGDIDWTSLGIQALIIIIEVAIIIATWGIGGAAVAGGKAAAHAAVNVTAKHWWTKAITWVVKVALKTGAGAKAFGKHIARKVAKIGLKKAIKVSVFTAAAFATHLLVQNTIGAAMTNNFYTYINFTEPKDLDFGYLSPSYIRDLYYTKEGDGAIAVQTTDDYIKDKATGETYFYLGSDRPEDFHSVWIATEVVGIGGDKYRYLNGEFEDIEINEYTDKINGIIEDDEDVSDVTFYSNGKRIVYAVPMYKYKNGSYYINENACEVIYETQSLAHLFKKGTYNDGLGETKPFGEPHFIVVGNAYYNSGEFDRETEIYSYNQEDENLITYNASDKKYYFDGREVSGVEYNGKKLGYSWRDSASADAREGYTWFNYAYFAAAGDHSAGVSITLKFGDEKPGKPTTGTEGVDYISRSENVFELDHTYANGEEAAGVIDKYYYLVGSGNFKPITSADQLFVGLELYAKRSKTYYRVFDPNGSHEVTAYPYSFTNPYYDKTQGNTTKKRFKEDLGNDGGYEYVAEGGKISHNPRYYLWQGGYTISSVTRDNGDVFDLVYIQTDFVQKSFNVSSGDDGYTTSGSSADINIKIQNAWLEPTITPYGSVDTVALQTIVNNWSSYQPKYKTVNGKSGESGYIVVHGGVNLGRLDELYQVKEGKLFELNQSYSINSNNQLTVGRLQVPSDHASQGLYVSNREYGLYTRYKYTFNDSPCDFNCEITAWKNYSMQGSIIPLEQGSSMINLGRATKFSESCRVVLGTGGNVDTGLIGGDVLSGSINIG